MYAFKSFQRSSSCSNTTCATNKYHKPHQFLNFLRM